MALVSADEIGSGPRLPDWRDTRGGKPLTIFALLLARTVGDFSMQNVFAATVKQHFKGSRLFCYFRNDRDYKPLIVSFNPHIDHSIVGAGDNAPLLADYFDNAWQAPFDLKLPMWVDNQMNSPDLVLTPSMMRDSAIHAFPSIAHLTMPEPIGAGTGAFLASRGLDPTRWFCAVHLRESSFKHRQFWSTRNGEPYSHIELVSYIIDGLGGQVVRVGHKGAFPFPQRPGFIDLSLEDDTFAAQAFALHSARFNICDSSGMMALSAAFGTPTGCVNQTSLLSPLADKDVVLMKNVFDSNGTRIPLRAALQHNLIADDGAIEGLEQRCNTFPEMKLVADQLYRETGDCPGWRGRRAFVEAEGDTRGEFFEPPLSQCRYRFMET